jgi:DNA-binding SARP family transcriptional activator
MRPALYLLGGAHVGDRENGWPLPADRRGCLLAFLGFDGGWVDRDRVALLFWPEADEVTAKRNLRQLLLRVRQLDLAVPVESTAAALRWPVGSDVAAFRRALAARDAEGAVRASGGALLERFNVFDVGAFDAWRELERQRLDDAYAEAVLEASDAAAAEGRPDDALAMLRAQLERDPLAEDVVQRSLTLLAAAGRHDAARRAFERFERLLADELGLEPLSATRELLLEPSERPARRTPPAAGDDSAVASVPPLVGREEPLDILRRSTASAIVIAGEAGVGKSRLLTEALPEALRLRGLEGMEGVPYAPFANLLRERPELAEGLGRYRDDLGRLVPDLLGTTPASGGDPSYAKVRLLEALARLVTVAQPPLVVDDLQWLDAASLEALVYLVARGHRLAGAYRRGEVGADLRRTLDALQGRQELVVLRLEPLDEEGVRALLATLMGRGEGPPVFSRWLWRHSGGNPFFALETIRSLFETGILRRRPGGWETGIDEVTPDYEELEVPPAVAELVGRRLERLTEGARRVLQCHTVLPRGTSTALLGRVAGLSTMAVADALDEAATHGFLDGSGFRHDLLRQSVARGLTPARRRALHRLAAEALDGEADDAIVAEHWFEAGDAARARQNWYRYAGRLRERGLQHAAVDVLELAVARYPPGEDRSWLLVTLSDTLRETGQLERAAEIADEALQGVHDEPTLRLRGIMTKAAGLLVGGLLAESEALLETSLPLVALVEDDDLRFDHIMMRARVAHQAVRLDEALALLEPELERRRRGPADVRLCQVLTSIGTFQSDAGRFEEALAAQREALALARALQARYVEIDVAINLLFCYADLQRLDEVDELARATLSFGEYDGSALFRTNLASVLFEGGRIEAAREHYRVLAEERHPTYLRAIALARCAEAHHLLEERGEVPVLLDAALDLLPGTDFPITVGRVAVVTLTVGDDEQVGRLLALVPDLPHRRFPPYMQEAVDRAWRGRTGPAGRGGGDTTDGGRAAGASVEGRVTPA